MAYSNWYKCIKLKYIIFGFLVLPFAFNWILNLNCGFFNVIGGKAAPVVWLQFWGTYLAAVAAFCVIFQNEKQKLLAEEKECKRRIVNYIVHQVGNNIPLRFIAIFNEILEFKNSTKSVYETDVEDPRIPQYNLRLCNFECEIHISQIELLSIPYNGENTIFEQYTRDLEFLFKTMLEMINKTQQNLRGGQMDLGRDDLEYLKELNDKLLESAKQILNNIQIERQ